MSGPAPGSLPAIMAAPYLTVRACAALLDVDHKTVRRLIDRGELPALRVGRAIRISPADLRALAYVPPGADEPRRPRPRPPSGEFTRLARTHTLDP